MSSTPIPNLSAAIMEKVVMWLWPWLSEPE